MTDELIRAEVVTPPETLGRLEGDLTDLALGIMARDAGVPSIGDLNRELPAYREQASEWAAGAAKLVTAAIADMVLHSGVELFNLRQQLDAARRAASPRGAADELRAAAEFLENEDDEHARCRKFPEHVHEDGCGGQGLDCAAIYLRARAVELEAGSDAVGE